MKKSKYFKSVKLIKPSERPEHIQLDMKATIEDIKNEVFDWYGRATEEQIQDITTLFCGMANKRQTNIQRMFEHAIKEMKREGRVVNEK